MKIFLLEPTHWVETVWGRNEIATAFVVLAQDEEQARTLANEERGRIFKDVWLDKKLTRCSELKAEGSPRVVVREYCP